MATTTIHYPRLDATPASTFTQDLFDRAHAQLMSWQQAPGAFGDLHLHACWGDSSVMTRRYHGQSIFQSYRLMRGFLRLFEQTGEARWKQFADNVVENILFLQAPGGGFYHASSEYEPTYTAEESCPIHQGLPLLALLLYVNWPHADAQRKGTIRDVIDRHWRWFESHWWKRGNQWKTGLDFAGFCGVTNQDLVIVAALAQYAVLYGDDSRYEQFGRPTLETYVSPRYYHERIGLFERGDRPNFAERTVYYDVIIPMLRLIDAAKPDARIQPVIDNVTRNLFSASYVSGDGLMHLAYGAETFEDDKRKIKRWVRDPRNVASYPGHLHAMAELLHCEPNAEHQRIYDELERTVAAYTFTDGNLPLAIGGDPLFAVVSRAETRWLALMDRLGNQLRSPAATKLPVIHRSCGSMVFQSDPRTWAIVNNGKRLFMGLKSNPSAIAIGAEEELAGADATLLSNCEVSENISASPPAP
jgi:hypothetical protein